MSHSFLVPASIGRAAAVFSIVGSSLITYMIMTDRKRKLSRPYHRIMLMMSVFDIIQSASMVFSISAFPRQSGIRGAKGNELTCAIQGFFLVLGLAVPLYNSCLNIYYLLSIRYNVSLERFSKYEYILHAISILLPLSMAIMLTIRDPAKPRAAVCYPRGNTSLWVVRLILSSCFLICIASMICICWTVFSQATKTRKYTSFNTKKNSPAQSNRVDKDKNKTIKQACLYMLAFLLTYTLPFVSGFYTRGIDGVEPPYVLMFLTTILYPLQGCWNFVFYVRPGIQREIKLNPEKSLLRAIGDVIFLCNNADKKNCEASDPLPTDENVETGTTPHMSIHMTPDGVKHVCTNSSYEKLTSSKREAEFLASDSSVLQKKSHDSSDDAYLGNIPSQVTESTEATIIGDNVEHGSDGQRKCDTPRRLSLLDIASILDGQETSQLRRDTPRRVSLLDISSASNGRNTYQLKHYTPKRLSLPDIVSISVSDGHDLLDTDTEAELSNSSIDVDNF